MLVAVIMSLFCTVSAYPFDDDPYKLSSSYSRSYLRGLRIDKLIHEGAEFITESILAEARKGSVKYTLGPITGCEAFKTLDLPDKETCEHIVKSIETVVSRKFPDIDVTYDDAMKTYTLKWD